MSNHKPKSDGSNPHIIEELKENIDREVHSVSCNELGM
jgi:hypothetical protein